MKLLKYFFILSVLLAMPNCASHKKVVSQSYDSTNAVEKTSSVAVSKNTIDSVLNISNILSKDTFSSKDITIKETETPYTIEGQSFITKGKLVFDTTSSQDTVKYIDIDNPDMTLKVYADRKTKDIIAEVHTKNKTVKIPGKEVSIKTLDKGNTTSTNNTIKKVELTNKDSVAKADSTAHEEVKVIDKRTTKNSLDIIVPLIIIIIIFVIILYVKKVK